MTAWTQGERDSVEDVSEPTQGGITMLGTYYADRFVGRKTYVAIFFAKTNTPLPIRLSQWVPTCWSLTL